MFSPFCQVTAILYYVDEASFAKIYYPFSLVYMNEVVTTRGADLSGVVLQVTTEYKNTTSLNLQDSGLRSITTEEMFII